MSKDSLQGAYLVGFMVGGYDCWIGVAAACALYVLLLLLVFWVLSAYRP